ncbi:Tetratricopeptide repeat protein [Pseudodesulfovibrio hydrargyri]|uniref:Tetratricopeptide repeat protein n=1 Tax=Pseudodesulfovibrio hydrargyri TaxID=2125990 RepID=A0A1J5N263_9BACT|nr:tetratricopeptide repeat protein [Pseudodesulfovibrio hydrargyri]OIQ49715.1 Tetratricopeptide repeat protein [Pseudodesulfovibrio hydrargyri]
MTIAKIERHGTITAILAYIFLLAVQYYQLLNQDFILLDDPSFIINNPHIQNGLTLEGIKWAFSTNYFDFWHPFVWLSYMMDISLFGFSVTTFKLINAALHFCSCLMLFGLLRKGTDAFWPSLVAGALLLTHPIHVESVAWCTERKDVLFLFFGMASLYVYFYYAANRKITAYVMSLSLFACGLMAKTTLSVLPALMLLLDFWPLGRIDPAALRSRGTRLRMLRDIGLVVLEKVPFLVLAVLTAVIVKLSSVSYALDGVYIGANQHWIANWLFSYVLYVWKIFIPAGLSIFHPLLDLDPTVMAVSGLALLVAGSASALLASVKTPSVAVGWFWFVLGLVPAAGVYTAAGLQASMFERYAYLPAVGLYIAVAFGLWSLLAKRHGQTAFLCVAGSVLLVFSFLSWRQVGYWKNSETLFAHALEQDENNWLALDKLGYIAREEGRISESIRLYGRALAIQPGATDIVSRLALTLFRSGDWDGVRALYRDYLERYPQSVILYNDYGSILMDMGEPEEALALFKKALSMGYQTAIVHHNTAACYYKMGDMKKALEHSRQANELEPNNPQYMYAEAVAHANLGQMNEAKSILFGILLIDPGNEHARQALSAMGAL